MRRGGGWVTAVAVVGALWTAPGRAQDTFTMGLGGGT